MYAPLAIEVDAGQLTAAGALLGIIFAAVGATGRWLLTYRRDGQKSEIAGLWEIIRATETGCAEMKKTFDAMVQELDTERVAHADCRIGYGELYQCATMLRGLLVELVKESSNPGRYIPEMPARREEPQRRAEERRAVDKAVKEVDQNTLLLDASKKAAESSTQTPPTNGGRP